MATSKDISDLGSLYTQMQMKQTSLVTEAVDSPTGKQTVGKKQSIGEVKLTKQGGDEKVKKDLDTPKESVAPDGKPVDGEKALSQSKKTVTESKANMKQSLFDRVYKQIVNEDDNEFEAAPSEDAGLDDAAPVGAEGEQPPVAGEEEVIDPVAVIKEICLSVEKLKKHFGITDEPDGDEVAVAPVDAGDSGVPPVGEAVDMKEVPDSAGKSLQGKNNKVSGTKVNGAGKAEATVTTGDGKLEKAPDGEKLAGNKDNKVKGKSAAVTGGDKSALES